MNPGQDNIAKDANNNALINGVEKLASGEDELSLDEIQNVYTDTGKQYNQVVENAAANVGERQQQLIGNDFGATNPYMYNTYYQPSATSTQSQLRVAGAQAALEVGMERGKKAAEDAAKQAQNNYNNALNDAQTQAQKIEQARNLNVAEVDTSAFGEGTSTAEVLKMMQGKSREEAYADWLHNTSDEIIQGDQWHDAAAIAHADQAVADTIGMPAEELPKHTEIGPNDSEWWKDPVRSETWTHAYAEYYLKNNASPQTYDNYMTSYTTAKQAINTMVDYMEGVISEINLEKILTIGEGISQMNIPELAVYKAKGREEGDEDIQAKVRKKDDSSDEYEVVFPNGSAVSVEEIREKAASTGYSTQVNEYIDWLTGNVEPGTRLTKDTHEKFNNAIYELFAGEGRYGNEDEFVIAGTETVYTPTLNELYQSIFGFDVEDAKNFINYKNSNPEQFERIADQLAMVTAGADAVEIADGVRSYKIDGKDVVLDEGSYVMYTLPGFSDNKDLKKYLETREQILNATAETSEEQKEAWIKEGTEAYQRYYNAAIAAIFLADSAQLSSTAEISNAMNYAFGSSDEKEKIVNNKTAQDIIDDFMNLGDDHERYRIFSSLLNKAYERAGSYVAYDNEGHLTRHALTKEDGSKYVGSGTEDMLLPYDNMSPEEAMAYLSVLSTSIQKWKDGATNSNINPSFMIAEQGGNGPLNNGLLADSWRMGVEAIVSGWNFITGMFNTDAQAVGKIIGALTDDDDSTTAVTAINEAFDAGNPVAIGAGNGSMNKILFEDVAPGDLYYEEKLREAQQENLSNVANPFLAKIWLEDLDGITYGEEPLGARLGAEQGMLYGINLQQVGKFVSNVTGFVGAMAVEGAVTKAIASALTKMASTASKIVSAKIARGTAKLLSGPADEIVSNLSDDIVRAGIKTYQENSLRSVEKVLSTTADDMIANTVDDAVDDVVVNYLDDSAKASRMGLKTGEGIENGAKLADATALAEKNAAKAAASTVYSQSVVDTLARLSNVTATELKDLGLGIAATITDDVAKAGITFADDAAKKAFREAVAQYGAGAAKKSIDIAFLSNYTGVSVETLMAMPDNATGVLAEAGRALLGQSAKSKAAEWLSSLKQIDFKEVTNALIQRAQSAARAGKALTSDDITRTFISLGWKDAKRGMALKEFVKDALEDVVTDVVQGYTMPTITSDLETDRETVDEYFTNPYNYLFNAAATGIRYGGGKIVRSLSRTTTDFRLDKARNALMAVDPANTKQYTKRLNKLLKLTDKAQSLSDRALEQGKPFSEVQDLTNKSRQYAREALDLATNDGVVTVDNKEFMKVARNSKSFSEYRDGHTTATNELAHQAYNAISLINADNYFRYSRELGLHQGGLGSIRANDLNLGIWRTMIDARASIMESVLADKNSSYEVKRKTVYDAMRKAAVDKYSKIIPGLDNALSYYFQELCDEWDHANSKGFFKGLKNKGQRLGYLPINAFLVEPNSAPITMKGTSYGSTLLAPLDPTSPNASIEREIFDNDIIKALEEGKNSIDTVDADGTIISREINKDGLNFLDSLQIYSNTLTKDLNMAPMFGSNPSQVGKTALRNTDAIIFSTEKATAAATYDNKAANDYLRKVKQTAVERAKNDPEIKAMKAKVDAENANIVKNAGDLNTKLADAKTRKADLINRKEALTTYKNPVEASAVTYLKKIGFNDAYIGDIRKRVADDIKWAQDGGDLKGLSVYREDIIKVGDGVHSRNVYLDNKYRGMLREAAAAGQDVSTKQMADLTVYRAFLSDRSQVVSKVGDVETPVKRNSILEARKAANAKAQRVENIKAAKARLDADSVAAEWSKYNRGFTGLVDPAKLAKNEPAQLTRADLTKINMKTDDGYPRGKAIIEKYLKDNNILSVTKSGELTDGSQRWFLSLMNQIRVEADANDTYNITDALETVNRMYQNKPIIDHFEKSGFFTKLNSLEQNGFGPAEILNDIDNKLADLELKARSGDDSAAVQIDELLSARKAVKTIEAYSNIAKGGRVELDAATINDAGEIEASGGKEALSATDINGKAIDPIETIDPTTDFEDFTKEINAFNKYIDNIKTDEGSAYNVRMTELKKPWDNVKNILKDSNDLIKKVYDSGESEELNALVKEQASNRSARQKGNKNVGKTVSGNDYLNALDVAPYEEGYSYIKNPSQYRAAMEGADSGKPGYTEAYNNARLRAATLGGQMETLGEALDRLSAMTTDEKLLSEINNMKSRLDQVIGDLPTYQLTQEQFDARPWRLDINNNTSVIDLKNDLGIITNLTDGEVSHAKYIVEEIDALEAKVKRAPKDERKEIMRDLSVLVDRENEFLGKYSTSFAEAIAAGDDDAVEELVDLFRADVRKFKLSEGEKMKLPTAPRTAMDIMENNLKYAIGGIDLDSINTYLTAKAPQSGSQGTVNGFPANGSELYTAAARGGDDYTLPRQQSTPSITTPNETIEFVEPQNGNGGRLRLVNNDLPKGYGPVIPQSLMDRVYTTSSLRKGSVSEPITANINGKTVTIEFDFGSSVEADGNVAPRITMDNSPVETFSGRWTKDTPMQNPDKVFLFGDNLVDAESGYVPKSTQAVIRGQDNAIGIPTKKDRGTSVGSYFSDADFDEFKKGVDSAIERAEASGKTIVIPEDGIGTGKADLKNKAPKCYEYLTERLKDLSSRSGDDIEVDDNFYTPENVDIINDALADANNNFRFMTPGNELPEGAELVSTGVYGDLVSLKDEFAGEWAEIDKAYNDNLKAEDQPWMDWLTESADIDDKEIDLEKELKKIDRNIKKIDKDIDTLENQKVDTPEGETSYKKVFKDADDMYKKVLDEDEYERYHEALNRRKTSREFLGGKGDFYISKNGYVAFKDDAPRLKGYRRMSDLMTSNGYDFEKKAHVDADAKADKKTTKKMRKEMTKNLKSGEWMAWNTQKFELPKKLNNTSEGLTLANYINLGNQIAQEIDGVSAADIFIADDYNTMLSRVSEETVKSGKFQTIMEAIASSAHWFQDQQMAGGASIFNAMTITQIRDAIMSDPKKLLYYVKAVSDMKNNRAVFNLGQDNLQLLNEFVWVTQDASILNDLGGAISSRPGQDSGVVQSSWYNLLHSNETYKENLDKSSVFNGIPKAVRKTIQHDIDAVFSDATFKQAIPVLRVKMLIANYDSALSLIQSKFPKLNIDEARAAAITMSYARTTDFFAPGQFHASDIDVGLGRIKDKALRDFTSTAIGAKPQTTFLDVFSSAFFALRYKMTLSGRFWEGIRDYIPNIRDRVKTVGRTFSPDDDDAIETIQRSFVRRGAVNRINSALFVSAIAAGSAMALGIPTAWDDLSWEDPDDHSFRVPPIFQKFQTIGQIWLPNSYSKERGFYVDKNKDIYGVDTLSSTFTLQNSLFRTLHKTFNPEDSYSAPQRGLGLFSQELGLNLQGLNNVLNTPLLRALGDELLGSNLLSPFKATYEVVMDSTYFGNNIWEKKWLPNGKENPNYDPVRNIQASIMHILGLDMVLDGGKGYNDWVKGKVDKDGNLLPGYTQQDQVGTVAGSGLLQHEYVTAAIALVNGDIAEALAEGGELPIKKQNLSSKARTELNTRVKNLIARSAEDYKVKTKDASADQKDEAYTEFVKESADIVANWSKKYDYVLGENQELVPAATKMLIAFLAGEWDDNLNYIQNAYWKAGQLAQIEGKFAFLGDDDLDQWVAEGKSVEEFAEEKNRRSKAYNDALDEEYKARKALEDIGYDSTYLETASYEDLKAEQRAVNKKIYTGIQAKLQGPVGEFKNYKEMKAYYETMIENTDNTKTKAKIANQYNTYVTDVIAPYIEEYGAGILNDAWYNNSVVSQGLSNSLAEYIIIPADKTYRGKSPRASYLKDLFGVGYRDQSNMPTDEEIYERFRTASNLMAKGANASAAAVLDRIIESIKKGQSYASSLDYSKIIKMRALLNARSK